MVERNRIVLVPVRDIVFLRAEQKYVTVRTAAREHLIEEPLVALEREFADALRAHPPQLPGGARRDPRLRAQRPATRTSRTGWWCSTALDERLPVSRRQWPAVRELVADK